MKSLNPWYVSGLIEGEGCFCITISRHKTKKLGVDARIIFEIEMIIDDKPLLEKLRRFFNCGHIYVLNYERYGWRPHVKYAIKSYKEIKDIIIPFFKRYKLQGKKAKDFEFFCQAAILFEKKEHLTQKGVKKLRKIQKGMNIRRRIKK